MFNNPLVVGHKGEIGKFILQGLLAYMPKASSILAFDAVEDDTERLERIENADIIFLCVPLEETLNWFRQYVHLLKGKIIVEQTTRKEMFLLDSTKRLLRNCEIVHMHLLFRPSATPNIEDRMCAFIHPVLIRDVAFIEQIIRTKIIYYKDIEHHESAMSVEQGLLHKNILIMDKMIREEGGPNTFMAKRICELADRIRAGKFDLYEAIQQNPNMPRRQGEFFNHYTEPFENLWVKF